MKRDVISELTKKLLFVLFCGITMTPLLSCSILEKMQSFKNEKYETGAFKGAQSCKNCHKVIYDQWENSIHAKATKDPFTPEMMERLPFFRYKLIMGEKPCYACHGPKDLNEGVSCEVCHGINDQDDVMDVHETKYGPNMARIRKADFCAQCHEAEHPLTGEIMMTTVREWRKSKAFAEGKQCVDCHMESRGPEGSFHGFSSKRNNVSIYRDAIEIRNFSLNYPYCSLDIENRITGNYLPTGAPEPVLFLEVHLEDGSGETMHSFERTFKAVYSESMGFPAKLLADNRLRDGETRHIRFTLPDNFREESAKARITVRFLDVDFVHGGDPGKARWVSDIFYEKTFAVGQTEAMNR